MPAADPPRTVLSDLLDPDDLDRAIAAKLVRSRRHPTLPVRILNYSTSCQVTRAWTPTTTRCRGLVVHDDNTVLARGWDKFWEPDPDSPLPTDTPVETTDKLDGSLSILVTGQPGGPFLSSRGGFANDQATHATALFRRDHAGFAPPAGWTALYEVLYPKNRIVLDYGSRDELVLLGAVRICDGAAVGPASPLLDRWTGPRTPVLAATTLGAALGAASRPHAEGTVVRLLGTVPAMLVKVKEKAYSELHFRLTETTEHDVWERLAADAWHTRIAKPSDWAGLLGVDPRVGERLRQDAPHSLAALTDGTPALFRDWTARTAGTILRTITDRHAAAAGAAAALRAAHGDDKHAAWQASDGHPDRRTVMRLYAGGDPDAALLDTWRTAAPVGGHKAWNATP